MAEKSSAHTAAPSDGGHPKTFPPLDQTTFAPQLVWLAVAFVLLYALLSRLALPRISEVIEERKERVQRDLAEAERAKAETEAALKAYEQSQAEARSRAQGIAKDMRDRLTAQSEKERHELDARMAAKLADTERQIGETKARALAGVSEIASATVGAIVGKLLGQEATPDEVQRALSGAAE
jgi:F-type H+-transporting ATPase subunit b